MKQKVDGALKMKMVDVPLSSRLRKGEVPLSSLLESVLSKEKKEDHVAFEVFMKRKWENGAR